MLRVICLMCVRVVLWVFRVTLGACVCVCLMCECVLRGHSHQLVSSISKDQVEAS